MAGQAVKVFVNLSGVEKKLSQQNIERGRYALSNQVLSDMTPYIPRDQGTLRTSGRVQKNGETLTWQTPYSKAQFRGTNGIAVFKKYTTPGTGKRWDLVAKRNHGHTWPKVLTRGMNL